MAETPEEAELLARCADDLVDAADRVVAEWVRRCVLERAPGADSDGAVAVAIDEAGQRCRAEVVAELRTLLATDVDAQVSTPLQVLRHAVRHPTAVLAGLGAAPVERDEFDRRAFPDDVYGLTPAGFGDVDPSLAEPGLVWGAAKAHVHLARHRPSS